MPKVLVLMNYSLTVLDRSNKDVLNKIFCISKTLSILIYFIIISCNNEKTSVSESELQQKDLEERKALVIDEIKEKYQDQSKRFNLYLGLKQFDKNKFKPTDTLITFMHDFSFAAAVRGKVCQILKTDSSIFLSEVYYGNKQSHLKSDSGFAFVNFYTGEKGSTVHSFNSSNKNLKISEWNTLMIAFDKECFFYLPSYNSEAVLDGTLTRLSFECQNRTYIVQRNWLENDSFYQLCKLIDSLTNFQLDNL